MCFQKGCGWVHSSWCLYKSFVHEFIMAETTTVQSTDIINGLQTIELEDKIPEKKTIENFY